MLDFGVGFGKIFMNSKTPPPKSVFAKLIEPLDDLVDKSKLKRKCKTLSDRHWIEAGLLRILSQEISGREFLHQCPGSGKNLIF